MELCDVIRIGRDRSLQVNPIMRDCLGFQEGATTYYYLVESVSYSDTSEKQVEYRVIVSCIQPQIWGRLYDLEFLLGDAPGAFATLSRILAKLGITTQLGESRTTLWHVRSAVTLTAWFKKYEGALVDLDHEMRKQIKDQPNLRKHIKPVQTDGDTEIWVRGKPSLLQEITFEREFAPGTAGKSGHDVPIFLPPGESFSQVRDGKLYLPKFIIEKLDELFTFDESGVQSMAGGGYAIINVDLDSKLISMTFPNPEAHIVKLDFHTEDDIGVLAGLSESLGVMNRRDGFPKPFKSQNYFDQRLWRHWPRIPTIGEDNWQPWETWVLDQGNYSCFLNYHVNVANTWVFNQKYYNKVAEYRDNYEAGLKAGGLGYRFVLTSATYNKHVLTGDIFTLNQTWVNRNVGRAYRIYPLKIYFIEPDTGKEIWSGVDDKFDQTPWIKGQSYDMTSRFSMPDNLPSGTYDLRIAMVDGTGSPRIALAIAGGDAQKRYRIGTVTVSPSSRSEGGRAERRQNSRMPSNKDRMQSDAGTFVFSGPALLSVNTLRAEELKAYCEWKPHNRAVQDSCPDSII